MDLHPLMPYLLFALQVGFAVSAGWACVAATRWCGRVWTLLGLVVGVGVLVRAVLGVGLFLVSYYEMPVLSSLQSGGGFWSLAPDARSYHELAAAMASGEDVLRRVPSPSFVAALALWMRAAGDTPVTAVLFNLALYVATCTALVAASRPLAGGTARWELLLPVAAFTFSPVLILLGTQPLKDVFFTSAVVWVTLALAPVLARGAPPLWRQTVVTLLVVGPSIYLVAGVRAYYALMLWFAAAAAIALRALLLPRVQLLRGALLGGLVLATMWCAFMWGAGPSYRKYGDFTARALGIDRSLTAGRADGGVEPWVAGVEGLRKARRGFVSSGGATNLATGGAGSADGLAVAAKGVLAQFVPITLLSSLSLVEFSGGRGFLFVTDVDTIFIDLVLCATAWMLIASRQSVRHDLPFICFLLALGLVSAALMAYIVTNFGTLFRLRLMAVVPFWLLPIALARGRAAAAEAVAPADARPWAHTRTGRPAARSQGGP